MRTKVGVDGDEESDAERGAEHMQKRLVLLPVERPRTVLPRTKTFVSLRSDPQETAKT